MTIIRKIEISYLEIAEDGSERWVPHKGDATQLPRAQAKHLARTMRYLANEGHIFYEQNEVIFKPMEFEPIDY